MQRPCYLNLNLNLSQHQHQSLRLNLNLNLNLSLSLSLSLSPQKRLTGWHSWCCRPWTSALNLYCTMTPMCPLCDCGRLHRQRYPHLQRRQHRQRLQRL